MILINVKKQITALREKIGEFFVDNLKFQDFGEFLLDRKKFSDQPESIQIEIMKRILVTCSRGVYSSCKVNQVNVRTN